MEREESNLFSRVSVRVFVENSEIYSLNNEEASAASDQEFRREYVLSVPVYKECWVLLSPLVEELSRQSGLDFDGYQILYRMPGCTLFVLAGTYPFESAMMHLKMESLGDGVHIKYRIADKKKEPERKQKNRRGNERKISDVINSLLFWRKLSLPGIFNAEARGKKLNRQEAADVLKIPKKSLEDYMLQVRLAYERGFDFNMYSNTRFGVIREFNRRMGLKATS